MREHDFEKHFKNEKHSNSPYMFPDQLGQSAAYGRPDITLQCLGWALDLDLARARDNRQAVRQIE